MFTSKHHPTGGAVAHCDSQRIGSLIAEYQANRDQESLCEILSLSQQRALALIRFYKSARYRAEDELLSDVNFKLLRAVDKFDPTKGSAFTFVSSVVTNVLCTSVTGARRYSERHTELSTGVIGELVAKQEDRTTADDITYRIRSGVKTILTDPLELEAQRWYITSFVDERFEARRHQCCDAAMSVYRLSHARSREIYDLTMLEVRRALYDVKRHQTISPGQLVGTRSAWMTRFSLLMDSPEFTRFFVLMRDLAPYLLLIIDPANRNSHRPERCPPVSRRNIELVLYGCPDARPLFRNTAERLKCRQ
jgi:hypothetical protein